MSVKGSLVVGATFLACYLLYTRCAILSDVVVHESQAVRNGASDNNNDDHVIDAYFEERQEYVSNEQLRGV